MSDHKFFIFSSKPLSSSIIAPAVNLGEDSKGVSDHHNLIRGEYLGINFPVVFRQEDGKKATDILETGQASFYLISDRLKEILEENHLTGWKTYPAQVYDKKGNEIIGYHGFSITGRCGPIIYRRSDLIEKRLVPEGPLCRFYRGMHFDIEKWDGSDFFLPERRYRACITQRAAKILKHHKITNMYIKSISEMEINARYVEGKSTTSQVIP